MPCMSISGGRSLVKMSSRRTYFSADPAVEAAEAVVGGGRPRKMKETMVSELSSRMRSFIRCMYSSLRFCN